MVRYLTVSIKAAAGFALALSMSACVTTSGSGSASTGTTPAYYATQSTGGLEVEPFDFDPADAPKACVNDLRVYRAHLQMPGASRIDLNKPVTNYVQEAGGKDAALNAVTAEINRLNEQLELEMARRNPFNQSARRRSDDTISTIEDGILLNEALAEALTCQG